MEKVKTGSKLIFINKNESKAQLEHARAFLKDGEIYTVKSINADSNITFVELENINGIYFNLSMFVSARFCPCCGREYEVNNDNTGN